MPRIVLVDTFKDEAEEALRVARALGDRLYGIRLDTPSERGRVTADLVLEVRARLDQAGFEHVRIIVSGGLDPDRIRYFKDAGAPVDSYAVGSFISGATPIDFTGDLKQIDGRPIAKRGRIPGLTESPRLRTVDLAALATVRVSLRTGRRAVREDQLAAGDHPLQQQQRHDGLGILDLASQGLVDRVTPGQAHQVQSFVHVGTGIAIDGREVRGQVEVHVLGGEAGRGEEATQEPPAGCLVARLLAQLPWSGRLGVLDGPVRGTFQGPGRDLQHHPSCRRPVLKDHEHRRAVERQDGHGARMIDDVAGVLAAVRVPDGVDTYGEVASGVDDAGGDGRFEQSCIVHASEDRAPDDVARVVTIGPDRAIEDRSVMVRIGDGGCGVRVA